MDWLLDITNWLREQFLWFWNALVKLRDDLLIGIFKTLCDFSASIVESIPVPEFMATYSLGALLGQTGPTVGWIFGTLRIGEGFAIIGAGYAFRLLRKLFTLGQW